MSSVTPLCHVRSAPLRFISSIVNGRIATVHCRLNQHWTRRDRGGDVREIAGFENARNNHVKRHVSETVVENRNEASPRRVATAAASGSYSAVIKARSDPSGSDCGISGPPG